MTPATQPFSKQLLRRQFDDAEALFKRGLSLNPGEMQVIAGYSEWLTRVGRHEEALAGYDLVLRHDPIPPSWYWELRAITLVAVRRYQEAVDSLGRKDVLNAWNHAYIAACCAQLERVTEAHAAVEMARKLQPDITIRSMMALEPYKNPADGEPLREGLRKAGLPA